MSKIQISNICGCCHHLKKNGNYGFNCDTWGRGIIFSDKHPACKEFKPWTQEEVDALQKKWKEYEEKRKKLHA